MLVCVCVGGVSACSAVVFVVCTRLNMCVTDK